MNHDHQRERHHHRGGGSNAVQATGNVVTTLRADVIQSGLNINQIN